jgi:hypothetical protein
MNDRIPDGDLLERARGGDHAAFRTLVERYEQVVAATVIGMLGPGAESEDVGQETFIRFYTALNRFREEATAGTRGREGRYRPARTKAKSRGHAEADRRLFDS